MDNQTHTPMEQAQAQGALYAEALETKKKANELLALDLMILELEAQQDMMDGLKMEVLL